MLFFTESSWIIWNLKFYNPFKFAFHKHINFGKYEKLCLSVERRHLTSDEMENEVDSFQTISPPIWWTTIYFPTLIPSPPQSHLKLGTHLCMDDHYLHKLQSDDQSDLFKGGQRVVWFTLKSALEWGHAMMIVFGMWQFCLQYLTIAKITSDLASFTWCDEVKLGWVFWPISWTINDTETNLKRHLNIEPNYFSTSDIIEVDKCLQTCRKLLNSTIHFFTQFTQYLQPFLSNMHGWGGGLFQNI